MLENLRILLEDTAENGIDGDFVEIGSSRGGTAILARAVQVKLGEGSKRRTYLCDSYQSQSNTRVSPLATSESWRGSGDSGATTRVGDLVAAAGGSVPTWRHGDLGGPRPP